jgi:cytidylate kinase
MKEGSVDGPKTQLLVERQMRLYNARHKPAQERRQDAKTGSYRFIAISRDIGSLGAEIAAELAQRLSWRVFDKEIVEYIARNSHVRESLVRELDEKTQSLIQDTIERLLRMAEGKSFGVEEYHQALLKTLATLAAQGEAIFIGRGAVFALREPSGLHLRIMASPATRIQRLSKRWQVPPDQAQKRMQQTDDEFREFIRYHFKQNRDDLRFYNLVFNTDHASTRQVVESVVAFMQASAPDTSKP